MEIKINWVEDQLTKCYTRQNLYDFLERSMLESSITKTKFSIMLLDLDHFKGINDKNGHLFGDDILRYFGSSLRVSQEKDYISSVVKRFVFRFGGDEFVVVFIGMDCDEATGLAKNMLDKIKNNPCVIRDRTFALSFSGGIATYPDDGKNIDELLHAADEAMYASKKNGKGRITSYHNLGLENKKHKQETLLKILSYGIVTLIMAIVLAYGLFFRSRKANKIETEAVNPVEKTQEEQVKIQPEQSEVSKGPLISTIYLKNGEKLRGEVISSGDDTVKINVDFGHGKYNIELLRSEISKIETSE